MELFLTEEVQPKKILIRTIDINYQLVIVYELA